MNNEKEQQELEQLLRTYEHAGRDERRRREVAEMIGSMAAEEGRRRRVIWRSVAVVAFIVAVAGIMGIFMSKEDDAVTVAENKMEAERWREAEEVVTVRDETESEKEIMTVPTEHSHRYVASVDETRFADKETSEKIGETEYEKVAEEELYVKSVELEENEVEVAVMEGIEVNDTSVTVVEPVSDGKEKESKRVEKKRKIWRMAQPSEMDGTVLAFKINI